MPHVDLVRRLKSANPGWPEWNQLTSLTQSLSLRLVRDEYLGSYFTDGERLTFAIRDERSTWPLWLPPYVPALFGLKAANYTMTGGFADAFTGEATREGYAFAGPVPDEQFGYPVIAVPSTCYHFQRNSSGALFHINERLEVVFPDASRAQFRILDTLEAFTRRNIRMALDGQLWFRAYAGLEADILD